VRYVVEMKTEFYSGDHALKKNRKKLKRESNKNSTPTWGWNTIGLEGDRSKVCKPSTPRTKTTVGRGGGGGGRGLYQHGKRTMSSIS